MIVERAKALAKLSQPEAAFISHQNWKTAGFTRRINILHDSINGHGMVVASSNNGAVENVTLELPSREAIDESWRGNVCEHVGIHASRLLNAPAWGLIAARLGNRANRREFLKRFWYDEDDDEAGSSRRRISLLSRQNKRHPSQLEPGGSAVSDGCKKRIKDKRENRPENLGSGRKVQANSRSNSEKQRIILAFSVNSDVMPKTPKRKRL